MIDVLKELEKREHVDLSSQIKQVESANNRIGDSLRSTNQLIDALKNGSSGKAEAVNVLRSLPDLNKALGNYRDFIKNDLNNRLLVVSNQITQELSKGQNTLSDVQSKLNTINRVIIAGQDIVTDGQNRIANIQSELPALEQTYINAMQTAQKYFPTVKKT